MAFLTAAELFQSLSDKEKAEILKDLQENKTIPQTPCERLGHNYKAVNIEHWLSIETILVCTRCGSRKKLQ